MDTKWPLSNEILRPKDIISNFHFEKRIYDAHEIHIAVLSRTIQTMMGLPTTVATISAASISKQCHGFYLIISFFFCIHSGFIHANISIHLFQWFFKPQHWIQFTLEVLLSPDQWINFLKSERKSPTRNLIIFNEIFWWSD